MSSHLLKRAFSLIELLVVIAIIIVLAVLTIPSISSIGRASALGEAAQTVAGTLDLARQTAVTQNRIVEVRLYKLPEDGQPSATPSDYRGMQLFLVDFDQTNSLTRPLKFPSPAIISDTAASSLMDGSLFPEQNPPPGVTVSPVGANYRYRCFRFKPNGTADLSRDTNWVIALANKNDPIKADNLPANYAKVFVEPLTGKITIERP